jgi:hypothetical protein
MKLLLAYLIYLCKLTCSLISIHIELYLLMTIYKYKLPFLLDSVCCNIYVIFRLPLLDQGMNWANLLVLIMLRIIYLA